MRQQYFSFFLMAMLILGSAVSAFAQDKYEVRQTKFSVYDKSNNPWNDPNAFLGVRLDATKKDTLEDQEISAGTTSYNVGGEYQRFALKFDASGGCYADVAFVVYKQGDKLINYEITLLRKEGEKYTTIPLTNRSIAIGRATPDKYTATVSIYRPMLMKDWLVYGGIMLASILFIYFVIFRWLFSSLLFNYNWPVSRAEYFTTSLSLMLIVAVFGLLVVLFLPQTAIIYAVLSLLSIFWVGHAITWALS